MVLVDLHLVPSLLRVVVHRLERLLTPVATGKVSPAAVSPGQELPGVVCQDVDLYCDGGTRELLVCRQKLNQVVGEGRVQDLPKAAVHHRVEGANGL